jgi:hypothetical protein
MEKHARAGKEVEEECLKRAKLAKKDGEQE